MDIHEKFLNNKNYRELLFLENNRPPTAEEVAKRIHEGRGGDLTEIGDFLGEVHPETALLNKSFKKKLHPLIF